MKDLKIIVTSKLHDIDKYRILNSIYCKDKNMPIYTFCISLNTFATSNNIQLYYSYPDIFSLIPKRKIKE